MARANFFAHERDHWTFIELTEEEPTADFFQGETTDEGWNSMSTTYCLVEGGVERHWCNDGVDCDGRLTRIGVDFCAFEHLACRVLFDADSNELPFKGPAWVTLNSRQRDFSAEAMGY